MADNTPKRIGHNFLHNHPNKQNMKAIGPNHVIVNKRDWELVVKFFNEYPDQFDKMVNRGGKAASNEMEIKL